MEGVKHDHGKTRWTLLPWEQVKLIADVMTFGAKKYAPDNWKKVPEAQERYFDAAVRHLTAWKSGEKLDPESGLPHLAHAGCCLLFMMWFDTESSQTTQAPPGPISDDEFCGYCGKTGCNVRLQDGVVWHGRCLAKAQDEVGRPSAPTTSAPTLDEARTLVGHYFDKKPVNQDLCKFCGKGNCNTKLSNGGVCHTGCLEHYRGGATPLECGCLGWCTCDAICWNCGKGRPCKCLADGTRKP